MFQVLIERKAIKYLEGIPEPDYTRIKKAILQLAQNPRPHGFKKLRGRPAFRIQQGDYRIIYEIHDKKLLVVVITIGHRKEVYE